MATNFMIRHSVYTELLYIKVYDFSV